MSYDPIEAVKDSGIVPIVSPQSVEACVQLVGSLIEGGATAIEIVLRSPSAMETLRECCRIFPAVTFAAGTALSRAQFENAISAGAAFAFSPGLPPDLKSEDVANSGRLVPGVQTATEALVAQDAGFLLQKFFPAEFSGGASMAGEFATMFSDLRFIPTGRISLESVPNYSKTASVVAVGGSWMHSYGGAPRKRLDIVDTMRRSIAAFAYGRQSIQAV